MAQNPNTEKFKILFWEHQFEHHLSIKKFKYEKNTCKILNLIAHCTVKYFDTTFNVSCLMVLSKVLEKIVCSQITDYMEKNKLIPDNQHGFRKGRSTMTALSDIQKQWTSNSDEKFITGILLWDLSAAFDTLSADIFWYNAQFILRIQIQ